VRRAAVGSARALFTLMRAAGVGVLASEQARAGEAFGVEFAGTPDLVLGPPPRVVDLKWGGAAYRRGLIERGAATQLAAYARLLAEHGAFPPVAYFILESQRLLSADAAHFPGAEVVPGPPPAETWDLLERAHAAAWQAVAEGRVEAHGVAADGAAPARESAAGHGVLTLEPPCGFCAFGALCGRSFAEDEA
jgi:hypothetical protein